MMNRKTLKKSARKTLKKHYAIFLAACLVAAFLGSEFTGSLNFSEAESIEQHESEDSSNIQGSDQDIADGNFQTKIDSISWMDVLMIIEENDVETGREVTEEIEENEIVDSQQGNPAFGRSNGVLANIVNQFSSGSIIVTMAAGIVSITGSKDIGVLIMVLLGIMVSLGFWVVIVNTFQVVVRRVFLEGMIYERVTPQRFIFLLRIKKWMRASWIMLVRYVLYLLWCLTLVGAVVKRYSYYLTPYIAAENPDITARQAITLSRRMMKGHKWECFKLEISFLGWEILGAATMGIFNVFYTNPYKMTAFAGYYAELRKEALKNDIPGTEILCDRYLYEKADKELIASKYQDVISVIESESDHEEKLTGWRGFLANNFGIAIMRRQTEREYEKWQSEYVRVHELIDDAEGLAYPTRLYPIPEESRRMLVQSLNYMRQYTVWSLITIFLSMSFIGWIWEVSLHLITDGEFVNRGALHGPWLPIYGSGAVLILTVLNRLRKRPVLEFAAIVLLCGTLEYMTSLIMEIVTGGVKWWDYSGYFLNLNGRICAEGLLVFGVGGLAIVYIIAPVIDNLIRKADEKKVMAVCTSLMVIFAADVVYSQFHPNMGEGITNIADNEYIAAGDKDKDSGTSP